MSRFICADINVFFFVSGKSLHSLILNYYTLNSPGGTYDF